MKRLRLYLFVKHKFGIKEEQTVPWWFIVSIRFLFYPLATISYFVIKTSFRFDPMTEIFYVGSEHRKISLEALSLLLENFDLQEQEIISTRLVWSNVFTLRRNLQTLKNLIKRYA